MFNFRKDASLVHHDIVINYDSLLCYLFIYLFAFFFCLSTYELYFTSVIFTAGLKLSSVTFLELSFMRTLFNYQIDEQRRRMHIYIFCPLSQVWGRS